MQSKKTIYIRFDLNDYSIPSRAIGRPLTLVASDSQVRILDGKQELVCHSRSYDRRQLLLDPAHQRELLQEKRKARGSTPGGRLEQAVPESGALLEAAFARGESAGSQTAQLLKLLDTYGPAELREAIREALEHGTPPSFFRGLPAPQAPALQTKTGTRTGRPQSTPGTGCSRHATPELGGLR